MLSAPELVRRRLIEGHRHRPGRKIAARAGMQHHGLGMFAVNDHLIAPFVWLLVFQVSIARPPPAAACRSALLASGRGFSRRARSRSSARSAAAEPAPAANAHNGPLPPRPSAHL